MPPHYKSLIKGEFLCDIYIIRWMLMMTLKILRKNIGRIYQVTTVLIMGMVFQVNQTAWIRLCADGTADQSKWLVGK